MDAPSFILEQRKEVHYVVKDVATAHARCAVGLDYDPVSHGLTDPNNSCGWLRGNALLVDQDPSRCVEVQSAWFPSRPMPLGLGFFGHGGALLSLCLAMRPGDASARCRLLSSNSTGLRISLAPPSSCGEETRQ